MKKHIDRSKLKLAAETVRSLETVQLQAVVAGNNPPSNRTDCPKGC